MRDVLKRVLDADMPNLVQMDVSALAGVLAAKARSHIARRCSSRIPEPRRSKPPSNLRAQPPAAGAHPLQSRLPWPFLRFGLAGGRRCLPPGSRTVPAGLHRDPFNDLAALERALAARTIAALMVEPIQGGVNLPADDYLAQALALCRKHGTLMVADEIQTGMGRTGRFLALEHWGVEPDLVLIAKSLSGGHVPVGAVLTRKWIFDKLFNRMDRAVVHGLDVFCKNDSRWRRACRARRDPIWNV